MIQDLTLEEKKYRYFNCLEYVWYNDNESGIDDSSDVMPKEFDGFNFEEVEQFSYAALLYLHKEGLISTVLHKEKDANLGVFTTSKEECKRTRLMELDSSLTNPSESVIAIPDIFAEEGNESYTYISVSIDYPNTVLGEFCKRMVSCLRMVCRNDVHVINSILIMDYHFNEETYSPCLSQALEYAFQEQDDNFRLWTQLPTAVGQLMCLFFEHKVEKLYDPFMRTGINGFISNTEYHAQATSRYHYYAMLLFTSLNDMDSAHITYENCIESWNPQECDTIVATPNLSQQVTINDHTEPISSWLMEKVVTSMDIKGRQAVLLLPSYVLTAEGKYETLRHNLIKRNLIDVICLLPAGVIPTTGASICLIYLSERRQENNEVVFYDFSSFSIEPKYHSKWFIPGFDYERAAKALEDDDSSIFQSASIQEIEDKDYALYPPYYIDDTTDVPNGYTKLFFHDIMKDIYSKEEGTGYNVINEEHFINNPFKEYPDCLTYEYNDNVPKLPADYIYINEAPFLAIRFKDTLQTYWYKKEDWGVHLLPDSHLYHVNREIIDIDYLRMVLDEQFRRASCEIWSEKSIKQFLRTKIVIPIDLVEQKRLYDKAKVQFLLDQAHKQGLDDAINYMKEEYKMEVRMRKHDMKPFISQLDSQTKIISYYLDKIEGNDALVASMREKVSGMLGTIVELRTHLNRLTEEDIYGTPEVINPIEFLKQFEGFFGKYSVSLNVDFLALEEAGIQIPQLYISPVDLSAMVNTIIENAIVHAFEEDRNNYKVLISFSYDKYQRMYEIDFQNNGRPMPIGMDKFRYGLKGEKGARSNGTGLGGYRVKSITRHYGGDYEVYCDRVNNVTTISVMLPKYTSNE